MIQREPTSDFDTDVRDYMTAHQLVTDESAPLITEESPAGRIALGLVIFGVAFVAAARYMGLLP